MAVTTPRDAPVRNARPARGERDVLYTAARASVGVIAVAAIAFGLWKARSIVILLLLALTFAAAMRPGVEGLRRRRVPEPLAHSSARSSSSQSVCPSPSTSSR
jgi:hypothetical protein